MSQGTFEQLVKMKWSALWAKVRPVGGDAAGEAITAECDDASGLLIIMPDRMGDVHLYLDAHPRADDCGHHGPPRFRARTFGGGGRHERTRQALLLLALAIIEDADPTLDDPPL